MAVDAATQTLIDQAACTDCQIPQGFVWYAVLAALIDVNNGVAVPTDSATLMAQASCLEGCIPAGYLPYVILQAVRGVSSLPTGNAGAGSPEGVVTGAPGSTYYNTSDQSFWVKGSGTGNTGWQQVV